MIYRTVALGFLLVAVLNKGEANIFNNLRDHAAGLADDFSNHLPQLATDHFNKLANNVKQALKDASKLAKLAARDLVSIPLDVLATAEPSSSVTFLKTNVNACISCRLCLELSDFFSLLLADGDFADRIPQIATDHFNKLANNVKRALKDASKLFKLSASDLASIPFDVLATSPVLKRLNATQFQLFAPNISTTPSSVLEYVFDKLSNETFTGSLKKLKNLTLSARQYYAVAKAAVKAYGKDVSRWTHNQFRGLGKLNFGLTMNELKDISRGSFDSVIDYFKDLEAGEDGGRFSSAQIQGLLQSAKKAWGRVSQWSAQRLRSLRSLATRFPVQYLTQLDANAVADIIGDWGDDFEGDSDRMMLVKKSVLIDKLKTAWGKVSQWTASRVENAKGVLDGLKASDLRSLNSTGFVGKVKYFLGRSLSLSWQQLHAMAEKTKMTIQDLSKLGPDVIEDSRRLFPGFLISDLRKLNASYLVEQLQDVAECYEGVQESFSQIELLTRKVFNASSDSELPKDAGNWDKYALDKLGCLARGLVCDELEEVASMAVVKSSLRENYAKWSPTQLYQLVSKFPSTKKLSDLGSLVNGINFEDIAGLAPSGLDFDMINDDGYRQMSRSQLLALVQRLKAIKTDLSDESEWGWDAIKRVGRALLSLSPQDLSQLPEESYEDAVGGASHLRGWTEGQAKAIWMTIKKRSNLTSPDQFANVTDRDISAFGYFVAQIGLEYLDNLDLTACKQAIHELGETEDLSSLASPRKRSNLTQWALQCLRKEEPSLRSLTSDHLVLLGRLVISLDESALAMITKEALSQSLELIGYLAKDATVTELQRLANLVKKHWSVGDLTEDQIVDLGSILQGFSPSDIGQMDRDNIVAALDDIGVKLRLTPAQANSVLAKVKAAWGSNVTRWGADQLLRLGRLLSSLSRDDLQSLSSDVFDDVVDYLGQLDDLDSGKLSAILNVTKKAWGPISSFTTSQFRRLGRLGVGISVKEWSMLKASPLKCSDTGRALGQAVNWSSGQINALGRLIKTKFQSPVSKWTTEFPFTTLGNLSVVLNASEFRALPPQTVRRAAGVLGKVVGFVSDQKTAIVNKLKDRSNGWGSPSLWTRAQISNAGNLLSGFTSDDIKTLNTEQLGGIDQPTIGQLGSGFFSAMQESQLESLEPQQARLVLGAYSSSLTAEQVEALERSAGPTDGQTGGPTEGPKVTPTSGGNSIFGISFLTTVGLCMIGGLMNHF